MFAKRVISFVLMLLILFADSGQTIYAHTCLKTKQTQISIGEPKHCCTEKKAADKCVVKKSSCCEVSSKYLKEDFINQQTEAKEVSVDVAVLPFSQLFILDEGQNTVVHSRDTSPPIVISKSENTFTQTFRL